MVDAKGPFRVGALFVALSAIVHLIAPFVSRFDSLSLALLPAGLIYLAFAYGLLQGWRWLAYLVFIVMMVGGIASLGMAWSSDPIPTWVFLSFVVLDWLAVFALFGALWRSKPATA
jgi:predicted membrane channel-forming protein YqfA (hemolysin III family)